MKFTEIFLQIKVQYTNALAVVDNLQMPWYLSFLRSVAKALINGFVIQSCYIYIVYASSEILNDTSKLTVVVLCVQFLPLI